MTWTRFRHVAIERAESAPTDAEFSAIESELGASLPDSFRTFLAVANGGSTPYFVDLRFPDGHSEQICYGGIFSTSRSDGLKDTFVEHIRSLRDGNLMNIPAGVLPFAIDGGGAMIFLDLTVNGNGRVVAYVEGLPEWAGKRTESSFVEVATSFDEYIDKLQIDRDTIIGVLKFQADVHHFVDEPFLDIAAPKWRDDLNIVDAVVAAQQQIACSNK